MSLCDHIQEHLSGYVDAELSPEDRRLVHAHLAECPECRRRLEQLQRVAGHVRELAVLSAPPELLINVSRHIRRDDPSLETPHRGPGIFRSWQVVKLASAAALLVLGTWVGVLMLEQDVRGPVAAGNLKDNGAPENTGTAQAESKRFGSTEGRQALKGLDAVAADEVAPGIGGASGYAAEPRVVLASTEVDVRRVTIRTRNVEEAVQVLQQLTVSRADTSPGELLKGRSAPTGRDGAEASFQDARPRTFIQSQPDRVVLVMDDRSAAANLARLQTAFHKANVIVEEIDLQGDRARLNHLAAAAQIESLSLDAIVDADTVNRAATPPLQQPGRPDLARAARRHGDAGSAPMAKVEPHDTDRQDAEMSAAEAAEAAGPPAPARDAQAGTIRLREVPEGAAHQGRPVEPADALAGVDEGKKATCEKSVASRPAGPEPAAAAVEATDARGTGKPTSRRKTEAAAASRRIVIWEVNLVPVEQPR